MGEEKGLESSEITVSRKPTIEELQARLTRIPPDIEQRVGAAKNYTDMTMTELRQERDRLTTDDTLRKSWEKNQALEKLVESVVTRREKDKEQLQVTINSEPIPEGKIRVYRGEDEEGLGQYSTTEPVAGKSGKWFTTNLAKAAAFAENKGDRGRVRYMDIPASDFEAQIAMTSSNQTDIQIPVGYDIQAGSKVLMSDGRIPPKVESKKDQDPIERIVPPTELLSSAISNSSRTPLGSKITRIFSRIKPNR